MFSNFTTCAKPDAIPPILFILRPLGQWDLIFFVMLASLVCFIALIRWICAFQEGRFFVQSPILTHITLDEVQDVEEGRRSWAVKITHNGHAAKIGDIKIRDPLRAEDYPKTFRYAADGSYEHRANDRRLIEAQDAIRRYAAKLLSDLGLDEKDHGGKPRNIVVIERTSNDKICDDSKSLHNPVWEILEDVSHWKRAKPDWISVTRAICPQDDATPIPQELGSEIGNNNSIRILLIVGRNLSREGYAYQESVEPDLAQRPIMQVLRHLEHVGRRSNIHLDIIQPMDLQELEAYLNSLESDGHDDDRFDIIHVDMHGVMLKPAGRMSAAKEPHFEFTRTFEHQSSSYVLVSSVAKLLQTHTRLLVVNACNSSSSTGELGIRMMRTLLDKQISRVSATSYRLLESSARIFYPSFYMSLFLFGSFSKAASDARLALRSEKNRVFDRESQTYRDRDDYFIHWNWSKSGEVTQMLKPVIPWRLCAKMLLQMVFRGVRDPMRTVYRHHLESHVLCAQGLDVFGMTNHALEVEYMLKSEEKYSVYLCPSLTKKKGEEAAMPNIRNTIFNMVPIWVNTNFVSEVRVVHIKKMKSLSWMPCWAWDKFSAEWTCRQLPCQTRRRMPKVKRMLIIYGIDELMGADFRMQESLAAERIRNRLSQIAREMASDGEDFYLVVIGGILYDEWSKGLDDFNLDILGAKFTNTVPVTLQIRGHVKRVQCRQ
ncbi:hypothetical protein ACN47E_001995 [Coniothyrium glycines]